MESRELMNRFMTNGVSRRSFLRMGAMAAGTIAVTPLLAACGGDDDDVATPQPATTPDTATTPAAGTDTEPTPAPTGEGRGGRIVHVRSNDSDSLDPQRTIASASWFAFSNIFDTLVTKNMDLEFEPLIAESWEISEDGLDYEFTIRQGMTFHDGTPVTAEAVKFTFDRVIDPDATAPSRDWIEAYADSEVIDENTVVLHLSEPSAPFMSNIAVAYFGIVSPEGVETHGAAFGSNPVGSGPWMFQEWREGEQITLVPFPDYVNHRTYVENTGPPLADELVLRVIPEAGTQIAAMETGEANHIMLPKSEVRNFQDDDDYIVFFTEGGTGVTYIEFATESQDGWGEPEFLPPFDDLRMRQAVAYALDVDEIIATVLEGIADRNFGFMPTGLFAYDPAIEEYGYHHSTERANELLDEAGWTLANGVREKDGERLELTMWAWSDPTLERAVQVVQSQLGQVGIDVRLEILEVGTLIARLNENQHNINLMGFGWPEADILYLMSGVDWGVGNYHPEEYMELISAARTTTDLDERRQLYFEAQQIALADVMAVPLWTDLTVFMTRAELQGFKLGPDNINVWTDAWVED